MEDGQFVFSADMSTLAGGITVGWKSSSDMVHWGIANPADTDIEEFGATERRTMRFDPDPGQQQFFLRMEAGQ